MILTVYRIQHSFAPNWLDNPGQSHQNDWGLSLPDSETIWQKYGRSTLKRALHSASFTALLKSTCRMLPAFGTQETDYDLMQAPCLIIVHRGRVNPFSGTSI
jgi:hypothetical protein